MYVLRRSWKTIRSTPLGDLDQPIRLAGGEFFESSSSLIAKRPDSIDYLGHAEPQGELGLFELSKRKPCFTESWTQLYRVTLPSCCLTLTWIMAPSFWQ